MKSSILSRQLLLAGGLAVLFASPASALASDQTLIWSDEFDQAENSAPNPTKWVYELGANGWGNRELETYTDSRENSFIVADPAATDGKALVIRARDSHGIYTSARLTTQGKFTCRYGRIEARAKCPGAKGLWPAFWMLGENIATVHWPHCGEIDIMEMVGELPAKNLGTIHGPGYSGAHGISGHYNLPTGESFDQAYHVFAVDWTPDKIVWSVDDHVYHTVTPASLPAGTHWVYNQPFYLLVNLAVGGNLPGPPDDQTRLPHDLTLDYVRVYGSSPTSGSAQAAANRASPDKLK
jgi:beta-glucanase (GH16 family)